MFGKKLTDFWKPDNKTEQSSAGSRHSQIKKNIIKCYIFGLLDVTDVWPGDVRMLDVSIHGAVQPDLLQIRVKVCTNTN